MKQSTKYKVGKPNTHAHMQIFHRYVGGEEGFFFFSWYTFSPIHAPYFHVIKLFSGTNYNYALLKIIKNSRQALQLEKNLLPACFFFLICIIDSGGVWKAMMLHITTLPFPSLFDKIGMCECMGMGWVREQDEWCCPPPADVQASDFIYMCLSALRVVRMCWGFFCFFF